MEKVDHDLLLELADENYQLRRLYEEHLELEDQLKKFESRPVYSSVARMNQHHLKKRKLKGMDSIMNILSEHRALM